MDSLRGHFGSVEYDLAESDSDYDPAEDEAVLEPPPSPVGQDERRMQVRAYNFWAGLLEDAPYPSIDSLDPDNLPGFGPYSVLLDFSTGIEDPAVPFLGAKLALECGTDGEISRLSDVPSRSLLSRITDHYMQILANQAPIGFEAEFVNQRGSTILYRGILLPFSSDNETIDFIHGVINWKEMADQATTDELLLEMDQALEPAPGSPTPMPGPVTEWADGPVTDEDAAFDEADEDALDDAATAAGFAETEAEGADDEDEDEDENIAATAMPRPRFGSLALTGDDEFGDEYDDYGEDEEYEEDAGNEAGYASLLSSMGQSDAEDDSDNAEQSGAGDNGAVTMSGAAVPTAYEPPAPAGPATPRTPIDLSAAPAPEPDLVPGDEDGVHPAAEEGANSGADDGGLYDVLAAARELAQAARSTEDRSRSALYAAVGRAYDVSLAAQDAPEDFAELMEENGLQVQDRAPMTPVVKLVFGADYDKTRLTEYAAVLGHARRIGIARGSLAGFLSEAEGGLKGVVQAERRLRREEAGKQAEPAKHIRDNLAEELRRIDGRDFDSLSPDGDEFAVVMIRRDADGRIVLLGEISDDVPLMERVARKLVA